MEFQDIIDLVLREMNTSQSEDAAVDAVLSDMYDQIKRALEDLAYDYPDVDMPDIYDVRDEIQSDWFDSLDI